MNALKTKRFAVYNLKCICDKMFENTQVLSNSSNCGCRPNSGKQGGRGIRRGTRLSEIETSFNLLYNSYKSRANAKNRLFELSKDQFRKITSLNCSYCGVPPLQAQKSGKAIYWKEFYYHNGIDRIDSDKGYTIKNSQPCCSICNKAKRDLDNTEFLEWISRLIKHNL